MIHEGKETFGRCFDDFHIGDKYKHWPGKTITESDNNLFCLLTMNHHPVHLDTEFIKDHPHHKILVVGTLVLSLAVGISVRDTSGQAIANLEYRNIKHLKPVFIGDTIYAETEVIGKKISKSNPSRGVVDLYTTVYNQCHELVLSLKRKILVPTKKDL